MQLSERSYPHPVVGNADDVPDYEFQATITDEVSPREIVLAVDVASSCPSLNRLVAAGKAVYALHVECGRTLFRQAFLSDAPCWRVSIQADRLVGNVELCPFVVATQVIRRYRVDGSHHRYSGSMFVIHPGDVLAAGGSQMLPLDPRDPLVRIGSIFDVRRAGDPGDRPVEANFYDDKIHVTLSQPDADRYALLHTNLSLRGLVGTVFILPVLVQAVQLLADDKDGIYADFTWATVVRRRVEERELDWSNPLRVAQELYGRPVTRAFQTAQDLLPAD